MRKPCLLLKNPGSEVTPLPLLISHCEEIVVWTVWVDGRRAGTYIPVRQLTLVTAPHPDREMVTLWRTDSHLCHPGLAVNYNSTSASSISLSSCCSSSSLPDTDSGWNCCVIYPWALSAGAWSVAQNRSSPNICQATEWQDPGKPPRWE